MKEPETILDVEGLSVEYRSRRGRVQAVRDVSFSLRKGETLALIGESGSGKTTLGVSMIRLHPPAAQIKRGRILYRRDGREVDVLKLGQEQLRQFRWQECAMVFQSALNAFNPVLRIWDQIYDTARAHGVTSRREVRERGKELLRLVNLEPDRVIHSYPHELSGGMRQRVLIATSLLLNPQILLLDEPTTALDILTQRTIIDLLRRLKAELGFSMIFVSHDLSLAAELADRVATMYAGRIIETADVYDVFATPRHPYTFGLIKAVPTVAGEFEQLVSIPGSPPDLIHLPSGCKFHPRCPLADQLCRKEEPALIEVAPDHTAACFHTDQVRDQEAKLVDMMQEAEAKGQVSGS